MLRGASCRLRAAEGSCRRDSSPLLPTTVTLLPGARAEAPPSKSRGSKKAATAGEEEEEKEGEEDETAALSAHRVTQLSTESRAGPLPFLCTGRWERRSAAGRSKVVM